METSQKKLYAEKQKEVQKQFSKQKESIESIDNLIAQLQAEKRNHAQEMNRLQGENRLLNELQGKKKVTNSKKHGNTTNLQSKEG